MWTAVTRLSRTSRRRARRRGRGAPPPGSRVIRLVYGGSCRRSAVQEGVLDAIDAASALHALDPATWTWSRVDARPSMRPPAAVEAETRRSGRAEPAGVALGVLLPQRYFVLVGGVSSTVGVGGGVLGYSAGQWTNFRTPGRVPHRRRRLDDALLAGLCGVRRPLVVSSAGRRSHGR